MSSAPDVVVVGAGAIGAACALELAERGASVQVLERGEGWAHGCSAGNAGLIVPSHATPLATPTALRDGLRWLGRKQSPFALHPRPQLGPWLGRFILACARSHRQDAVSLLRTLAAESLERWGQLVPEQLQRSGVLCVYMGERAFANARGEAAAHVAAGLRCEVLDASAALELEPALKGPLSGAVLHPDEAHGDPKELVAALGAEACARGARLRTGVEVRAVDRRGVRTATETIRAGRVVIATGVAMRELLPSVPVVAAIGLSVDFHEGLARPSRPLYLHDTRVVVTPLAGRTRLAGMLELAPPDVHPDTRRIEGVLAAARRALAAQGSWRAAAPWVGLRPLAPDGLPIVGALPAMPEVLLAGAHAMLGITLAPVTGRLIADAIDGHPVPAELDPGRFRALRRALVPIREERHVAV
ncbi:MAG TPA: FAD-dependent oxidoreductase [Solirubrobacteraceae bacterium]|nr:FAD-dependent oxidoreductase [Solirubrobacteraceae bacterium]